MRTVPTLLIGDLNTGLHYRDEPGATFDCSEAMVELQQRGWTDAWIEQGRGKRPPASWWSPGYKTPYRLDHALLSPVSSRATTVEYPTHLDGDRMLCGRGALSDHTPLVVTLKA
jgi:exonuclease III